jgi:[acyl-carrier-protein] S-malonyltransferase
VERAAELCKEAGAKRAVMLPVSAPFHCALMQPAQDALASDLATLAFNDPRFPVAANVSASFVATGDAARRALVAQVTGAVRWVECVELLAREGATHFVEVGPGRVLSGLMKQITSRETRGKDSTLPVFNVEDAVSLEKTLAGLGMASEVTAPRLQI